MVLNEGRHLGGTLRLVVHGPMNLHVAVKNGQELFLTLLAQEKLMHHIISAGNCVPLFTFTTSTPAQHH